MTILQGFLLGILQGVAEFLPISSSGHLALAQSLFGLEDVPLLYDIFLHMATLLAVTIYFWPKIWALLKCFGRWITKKQKSDTQVEISENDLLCPTDKIGQKTIMILEMHIMKKKPKQSNLSYIMLLTKYIKKTYMYQLMYLENAPILM